MAVSQSSEALRRPLTLFRLAFAVVAVVALVLGYVGMAEFVRGSPDLGHRWNDVTYYDLQLFVMGSDPLQLPGRIPWQLDLARFLAPSVTLYALFETARLLLSVELSRWRARRAKGHAIVCGDTDFADALSRRLQGENRKVVDIRSREDEFVTKGEPLRIIGDARDPAVLRAAGVQRARVVYACTAASAENAAIALTASRIRRPGPTPLSVHSHIPDPDLCATLQATFLAGSATDGARLDFFNLHHIAARRLFVDDPLLPVGDRAPHLVVTDAGDFAASVVVAAARNWRVCRHRDQRLAILLAGPGAAVTLEAVAQRYPFLAQVADVTPREDDLLDLFVAGEVLPAPDRLLVCGEDEERSLKTAMVALRLWRGRPVFTVVRLEGLATFLEGGRLTLVGGATDRGAGAVRVFGVISSACDPGAIHDDLHDRLAQVIHDRYRQGRRQRGEWADGDPALEPWDRLTPELRRGNRSQAEDIGRKLNELGCTIAPRIGTDEEVALSAADVEYLAGLEHERWCREREAAGWRYAPDRSDEHRLHPGLRPWHDLPQQFRNRTHHAIRELSDILADAGFRVVRG